MTYCKIVGQASQNGRDMYDKTLMTFQVNGNILDSGSSAYSISLLPFHTRSPDKAAFRSFRSRGDARMVDTAMAGGFTQAQIYRNGLAIPPLTEEEMISLPYDAGS